jgi:hypothetical protein
VRSNCEHGLSRATSTARPSRSCRALTPVGRSKRVSALPVPMHEQIIFRGATGQNCRFKSLPATSGLPPSTDIIRRCDWSGWCKKRKIARTANATSLSGKAASVPCKLPGKVPAGQISAFVVQPLAQKYSGFPKAQITFITGAIPSHTEGRFAIVTDVGAGCDGRDSVGRAGGRRAGLPVSDRTARGRTTLPTVFARTRRVHEARQDLWRGRARTAKSCGPGAPMLASSLAEMHLAQPGSGCIVNPKGDGGKQAGHRGEREVSRKPFAQGKPAYSG